MDCQIVTGSHIHHVYQDIHRHGRTGILHADEPSLEGEEREGCRSCPYTDIEILTSNRRHFVRTRHKRQHNCHKQPLYRPDSQCCHHGDCHALPQYLSALLRNLGTSYIVLLSFSIGLCSQTAGSDSEETEVPVQQIKEHCADGYSAYGSCVTQVSHNRGVHYSHQRDSYIRQDTRNSESQYFFIGRFQRCQIKRRIINCPVNTRRNIVNG